MLVDGPLGPLGRDDTNEAPVGSAAPVVRLRLPTGRRSAARRPETRPMSPAPTLNRPDPPAFVATNQPGHTFRCDTTRRPLECGGRRPVPRPRGTTAGTNGPGESPPRPSRGGQGGNERNDPAGRAAQVEDGAGRPGRGQCGRVGRGRSGWGRRRDGSSAGSPGRTSAVSSVGRSRPRSDSPRLTRDSGSARYRRRLRPPLDPSVSCTASERDRSLRRWVRIEAAGRSAGSSPAGLLQSRAWRTRAASSAVAGSAEGSCCVMGQRMPPNGVRSTGNSYEYAAYW
ncbi:hypothetical protein ABIA38_001982 [Embleya sp. AB8]